MNKQDLVNTVSEKTGLSKKDTQATIDAFVKAVEEALVNGEKVQLIGFGTFEVREQQERMGKNPQTGESVKIAACKKPAFKAGKALKDAVNE